MFTEETAASFEAFADASGLEGDEAPQGVINQLHSVLRPFILRRLKSDVTKEIPPKTELTIYCKLTRPQITTYKNVLMKNVDVLNGTSNEGATRLQNIIMQLRKATNHPYLFDGVEDKTLDPFGEHLIEHSGKLTLLDKLLPRLQAQVRRQVGPEVGPTSALSSCIITGMHGPACIFWAYLTPFSLQGQPDGPLPWRASGILPTVSYERKKRRLRIIRNVV